MRYLVALAAVLCFGLVASAQPRPGIQVQPQVRPVVNNYYFQPNYVNPYLYRPAVPYYNPYTPYVNPYYNNPYLYNYGFNYGFRYQYQYRFGFGWGW